MLLVSCLLIYFTTNKNEENYVTIPYRELKFIFKSHNQCLKQVVRKRLVYMFGMPKVISSQVV